MSSAISTPQLYRATSRFRDVWSEEAEICAYCACALGADDRNCPSCRRSLFHNQFRYAKPSTSLHILWVLLGGISQLHLIAAVLAYMSGNTLLVVLGHGLIVAVALLLTAGIYFRQWPAYIIAFLFLVSLIILHFVGALQPQTELVEGPALTVSGMLPPLLEMTGKGIHVLQVAAAVLALLWAAVLVGPNFARDRLRIVAAVDRGLSEPSAFFVSGTRYAKLGMWATAVLHWQRAAALYPTNSHYLLRLGDGYRRLGFTERALDVHRSALLVTYDEMARNDLLKKIAEMERPTAVER